MPQQHKRCRCATLTNGFLDPRCFALLRTASLGMTVRIVLRTASLGMTMMGPPFEGGGRVACPRSRGHVLKMQGAFVAPWPRFAWPCHPPDARRTTTDRMNSTQGQDKPQRITETTEQTWVTRVGSVPSVPSVANPMAGHLAHPTSRQTAPVAEMPEKKEPTEKNSKNT